MGLLPAVLMLCGDSVLRELSMRRGLLRCSLGPLLGTLLAMYGQEQPRKGFSLLRAHCPSCQCPSCWDLGCNRVDDEDAFTLSSCSPAPLATQKPDPAITDSPWSLARGLLIHGFSMRVALQQGHLHQASLGT